MNRMIGDRISFISAYCDSWCERCAFTERCSSFAARAAIAMCGDVRQGIELAVGRPRCADRRTAELPVAAWLADCQEVEESPDEIARFEREEDERRARLEDTLLMKTAKAVAELSREWLAAQPTELQSAADPVLREALAVAQYDVHLFWVKLYRALDGRDREEDELFDDPVQNDWNGSAKVALICIERSEAAWRVIAASTAQETPMAVAVQFGDLRHEVEREFPDAWRFIRPGFDEPGR